MTPKAAEPVICSLCVSIVTFRIVPDELNALLASLRAAAEHAADDLALDLTTVLVDNGQESELLRRVCAPYQQALNIRYIDNDENIGYGRAHNLVIRSTNADFHLMMNPDIVLKPDVLLRSVQHLQRHPDVVALSPEVRDIDGRCQYLCKRYPSVLDLALRGVGPRAVRRFFDRRLGMYECRIMVDRMLMAPAELISGCFMFCRGDTLRQLGGFNDRFFLYFEDFALSIELGNLGRIMYFPEARIVHYGGHAARKGWKHIRYFVHSAFIFFSIYGWKLA